MNKLAEKLIEEIYKDRETWGIGVLAKTLQKHSLHIGGERTLKKAAEILNVSYVETNIGGNKGKSYSKHTAKKIVSYVLETPQRVRTKKWLEMHPEEKIKRVEKRQQNLAVRRKERILEMEQNLRIKIWRCSKELNISKHKIRQLCERLKIEIIDYMMEKQDFEKLKSYLAENYSSNPHQRGRQLAMETWAQNNTGIQRGAKNSAIRKRNKELNRQRLENKLHVKCYTDKEAALFIGKNNSTLISGMKLLGLPMYKQGGSYIYDEESLIKLKNFYNNKNGLKGQVARLFEEYIRSKGLNYTCEKTFPDLYWHEDSKHPLRFDYYFTDYNLLVEVQGSQHFNPSSMGAYMSKEEIEKNFKGLQERDQLKRDYCISHSLPFIEIISKADFAKFDQLITEIKNKKDV